MKALIIVGLLLSLSSAAIADHADCMPCGSMAVCTGDHKFDVTRKCGSPDNYEVTPYDPYGSDSAPPESGGFETFYYNCGAGRYMWALTFTWSRLRRIRIIGYGSGPTKCY